ncbi:hypothetical protein FJ942_09735 [Mesorhizobium sp. B2-4-2]|uniref:hypothetical protein n=1 Tax=unclassified Mesorhizobium TaxID=325217 RepID=UPI001126C2BD|nr:MULTISPECIES: hypothetical protein [unclassified Mesorhizobium]MBZ9922110.1 hypothetical protein [Mesorhizobium sp. BR1-1-7]MBZ9956726.1 hypothetical protein [Mesorhizobium sp. BR1-1-14]MBZ9970252.1 hypothetical protein [Mesorhizobium sp. BR1-1-12]TPL20607.1 hypothetical protein FJ952_10135 [Mesorhizobium sp. B2-4-10]TPL58934.1 hypothetical protein FJ942_09735 [Mesorhizobium sp. B2-4-2]
MVDSSNQSSAPAAEDKQSRDQSTIQFPYGDQDDGISVARGIMDCGGVPVDADQLAAAMKQAPSSGNFRLKIATARTFGIIETVGGKYQLTELGFAIVDPKRERAARADSFLKVPLYKRVYDEFRGKQLPPRPAPLEHAFVGFGVAPKQKEKARHAFDRSASQAGYFPNGDRDRLVRPPIANAGENAADAHEGKKEQRDDDAGRGRKIWFAGGGDGGGGADNYHPFIQGLLKELPTPGEEWKHSERIKWLRLAANAFDMIYEGDGEIEIGEPQKRKSDAFQ